MLRALRSLYESANPQYSVSELSRRSGLTYQQIVYASRKHGWARFGDPANVRQPTPRERDAAERRAERHAERERRHRDRVLARQEANYRRDEEQERRRAIVVARHLMADRERLERAREQREAKARHRDEERHRKQAAKAAAKATAKCERAERRREEREQERRRKANKRAIADAEARRHGVKAPTGATRPATRAAVPREAPGRRAQGSRLQEAPLAGLTRRCAAPGCYQITTEDPCSWCGAGSYDGIFSQ
jgi:hypothetical protein